MLFYQYINVFLRREDLGHIKRYNDHKNTNRSIDSVDSRCADPVRFHFNATFRFFYALQRPKEILNIDPLQANCKTDMIIFRQI